MCWSTDLCAQFNMVLEPRRTRHFSSLDLLLDHFFEQFCNFAPSSTAPKVENLPLDIPSKWIVDQDFLINYAWCDENSKSAVCWPHFVHLIDWFTGLSVSFTAFTTSIPISFTSFATAIHSPSLHSKWSLKRNFSLLSTTTIGRRTWRCNYTPKGSSDSQWRQR